MGQHFGLTIHLIDRRYHGSDEWPPAPARVFQALVAGAAVGHRIPDEASRALALLESLAPPVIAAPVVRRGQSASLFVPNNDLDAVGGDPNNVEKIRTKKSVQPQLLESETPFLYAWPVPQGSADILPALADGLYQFGRGVDPAWAVGEVLDDEQLAARLRAHRGTVHRPTLGNGSNELAVPTSSSLASIVRRFEAALVRLRPGADGATHFVQPPKAHFAMVRYDPTPALHLFELRSESDPAKLSPWATWRTTSLIERIRDTAVDALRRALPDRKKDIERVLVGRKADGTNAGPTEERVRFIPLPSIGHIHVDQSIRRVLVHVPPGPLAEADVLWALSGRPLFDSRTGELDGTVLALGTPDEMVGRYRAASRTWRSVTPLALGTARRNAPKRPGDRTEPAAERESEERAARRALAQALRHAGCEAALVRAEVQREPFEAHGTRAERFATATRFARDTLWHVELELDREIGGPLVLGDGRFLGLGVMAPKVERGVFVLHVANGLHALVNVAMLARSLRRAVMARVQAVSQSRDEKDLPSYFHGHASNGEPLRQDRSTHLAFAVDVPRSRLLVVPPHVLDGWQRPLGEEVRHLETLERALVGFTELRAGPEGLLSLATALPAPGDMLLRSSRQFRSVTDYVVTRHAKRVSAEQAVIADVRRECQRRGLPKPVEVRIQNVRGVAGVGVVARVVLLFAVAVPGPLLLGKTRYLGGGLFQGMIGDGCDECESGEDRQ